MQLWLGEDVRVLSKPQLSTVPAAKHIDVTPDRIGGATSSTVITVWVAHRLAAVVGPLQSLQPGSERSNLKKYY